jgi:hypothetical protein
MNFDVKLTGFDSLNRHILVTMVVFFSECGIDTIGAHWESPHEDLKHIATNQCLHQCLDVAVFVRHPWNLRNQP